MRDLRLFGGLIVFVIVVLIITYSFREGFLDQAIAQHDEFTKTYAKKYNDIGMNLAISGTTGVLGGEKDSQDLFGSLTSTFDENGKITQELDNPYPLEENQSGLFGTIDKCEAVKTIDCNAFDDADFTKNCGICFDIGKDSKQKAHTGGLVLLQNDKADAPRIGAQMPQYDATVGSCPAGKLVASKKECLRLQKELACEKGNTFNTPSGCSQCYDDGSYKVVDTNDTDTQHLIEGSGTLYICGTGKMTFSENGQDANKRALSTLSNSPIVIPLLGSEGNQFNIMVYAVKVPVDYEETVIYHVDDLVIFQENVYKMVEGAGQPGYNPARQNDTLWQKIGSYNEYEPKVAPSPQVYGVLLGGTSGGGTFQMDIYRLVNNDVLTGRRPRAIGTKSTLTFPTIAFGQVPINPLVIMAPGFGKDKMALVCTEPFSFVNAQSQEASLCPTSPFLTKEASANFLQSDPCYAKGSGPGRYNLECLQGLFLTNGCVSQGKGYPLSASNAFNSDNTATMSLTDLADFIYDKAVTSATGVNASGVKQTMTDWSNASMFCTGRAITSPCDIVSGIISEDCIAYLWDNMGENKAQGSTYTLASLATGLFSTGSTRRFCNRSGSLSPKDINGTNNAANMEYWKKMKTVPAVRSAMAALHLNANNKMTSETDRTIPIQNCYGIVLGNKPTPRISSTSGYTGTLPGNSF